VDVLKSPRVVAATAVLQLLGFAIGFAFGRTFVYSWIGGAVGTLPGVLLGLAWKARAEGRSQPLLVPIMLGTALPAIALGFMLPRTLREGRFVSEMKRLSAAEVRRIEVQDLKSSAEARTLTDSESIAAFARACSDVEAYSPNHPSYVRSWYAVLEGPVRREIELHLEPRDPSRVFGSFVEKQGSTTWYQGSFQSRGLRAWVAKHLEDPPSK
jgi:hypothetical protein